MLYYLSQYILKAAQGTDWQGPLSGLRVFQYITFRSAGAAVTALLLSWWLGPKVILWLQRLKFGQHYVDKAEEGGTLIARVLSKKGTPTMGGILIVAAMDLTAALWAQWNTLVQLTLLSVLVFAGLGFYDDYAKITKQDNRGAAARFGKSGSVARPCRRQGRSSPTSWCPFTSIPLRAAWFWGSSLRC